MKSLRFVLTFLGAAAVAHAQIPADLGDVVLVDGRTIKGARIVSQSPTHVTLRSQSSIVQVSKQVLPDELRAKYPVDTDAAVSRKETLAKQHERFAVEAKEREARAIEKFKREAPARAAAVEAKMRAEAKEQEHVAAGNGRVCASARSQAESYFRKEYQLPAGATAITDMQVTIDTIAPVQRLSGQWNLGGDVWIEYRGKDAEVLSTTQKFTAVMIDKGSRFEVTLR